ncbi:MAG: DUF4255 domain-containing protein [Thermoproteota archaeon]
MIADLDETIRQLLIAELPVKNGEVEISFDQPKREWSARISKPTVNLFLYDVRENATLRQHQWERMPSVNGDHLARLKRTPFRVDCFYMLTTWAAEPEDEQRLLTRALMALFRFPILPEDRLIGSLKNPIFEIQARLASHDRLTNPAEVWSSLDNELRPSVSYIVTLALDPWKEIEGPIVRTLTLRTGQAGRLPRRKELISGEPVALIDGSPAPFTLQSNQTHHIIEVYYVHSEHQITFGGSDTIPEISLSTTFLLLAVLLLTCLALIAVSREASPRPLSRFSSSRSPSSSSRWSP